MANAVDVAETGEPGVASFAAPAGNRESGACKTVSPFSEIDEQITNAIIGLNRLPNAIERHARDEFDRSAQKAERCQGWVRKHEPELMERAERLAMFMGMGINPRYDATLRALLQPFEVPEGVFNGIEVSQNGILFQSGYEPKIQNSARQEPEVQIPEVQATEVQDSEEGPEVQAPGSKRKHPGSFDVDVEKPQYGSYSQNDFDQRQVVSPKRRRQDTSEGGEPLSSRSHLWPARPAFACRIRPEDTLDTGVREYGSRIQSGLASARPLYGPGYRPGDIFKGDVNGLGFKTHSDPEATIPAYGSRFSPEEILEGEEDVPNFESRLQSDPAGAESALNAKRWQHNVFENGTRPPFDSSPTGSRLRADNMYEAGMPGHIFRVPDEFATAGQVHGFGPRQPIPNGHERSNFRFSGEMTGPKRKPKAPPNQETTQQGISGAAKVGPVAKASGERWKKKYTIVNCPVVIRNGESFVELRCDRCHCNASGATGKFWLGARGIQGHLRKIHEEILNPAEVLVRCSVRSVSAEEVKRIESGALVIEKLFYNAAKGDIQDEGAAGRAQREGRVEGDREEEEEQEGGEEARPERTRKRRTQSRDFSKGKLKSTTW